MTSEEYDKLTDEEIRIKIAKFDGWKYGEDMLWFNYEHPASHDFPDYLNDLNACHEAVMSVPKGGNFAIEFERNLIRVLKDDEEQPCNPFLWMAKAGQLCKAFVMTMENSS